MFSPACLRDIGPICLHAVLIFLYCGNRKGPRALLWFQTPPKIHPPNMPYPSCGGYCNYTIAIVTAHVLMIQIFIENGIGAKAFKYLTSEDIDDKELGISFGGRRVLKRILKTVKSKV